MFGYCLNASHYAESHTLKNCIKMYLWVGSHQLRILNAKSVTRRTEQHKWGCEMQIPYV